MINIKKDKKYFNKFVKDFKDGKLVAPISFYTQIDGVYKCVSNIHFDCRVETFIMEKDAIAFCENENKL